MLIGLKGYSGSGKDVVAKILCDEHNFTRFALADELKEMLIKANLLTREEAYITKPKHAREMFQKVGTELFRNQVDINFWTRRMYERIQDFWLENGFNRNVVVSDIRFKNEAEMITKHLRLYSDACYIVEVRRPTIKCEDTHQSETEHLHIPHHAIINNNYSLAVLSSCVRSTLRVLAMKKHCEQRVNITTKRLINGHHIIKLEGGTSIGEVYRFDHSKMFGLTLDDVRWNSKGEIQEASVGGHVVKRFKRMKDALEYTRKFVNKEL